MALEHAVIHLAIIGTRISYRGESEGLLQGGEFDAQGRGMIRCSPPL
jgi:hypothetical protein